MRLGVSVRGDQDGPGRDLSTHPGSARGCVRASGSGRWPSRPARRGANRGTNLSETGVDLRRVGLHRRIERFVPHTPVIERASCVVCQAGMGITQKALAHGVPVVVIPFGRDQPEGGPTGRGVRRRRSAAAAEARPRPTAKGGARRDGFQTRSGPRRARVRQRRWPCRRRRCPGGARRRSYLRARLGSRSSSTGGPPSTDAKHVGLRSGRPRSLFGAWRTA